MSRTTADLISFALVPAPSRDEGFLIFLTMNSIYKVGVLTVSDRSFKGEREDASGPAIVESLPPGDYEIVRSEIVPDEEEIIARTLREWSADCDLILTTGGTGFSPRDVTPEATSKTLDRPAPGLAEALRAEGLKHTPFAMLSRGVAGMIGRALAVNLPGSPKGVREGMNVLLPVLPHALALLRGEQPHS
jgi:molybdenum cofactor synthesis domain-containing protein